MATNQTTNFNLPKWEKSDRIMLSDFNDLTEKLDTALAARSCQFYAAAYTGDGASTKTLTFPHKPMAILITRDNTVGIAVALHGSPRAHGFDATSGVAPLISWSGNTATLTFESYQIGYFNTNNNPYTLLALLDADD